MINVSRKIIIEIKKYKNSAFMTRFQKSTSKCSRGYIIICTSTLVAYVPVPVSFQTSQWRGHEIASYPLPGRSELSYEYAFRSINKAKTIMTYCCCTCRALNDGVFPAFCKSLYVHILNVNFITDPENPVNAHFYTPRSLVRALALCETIDVGNYLRENANTTPKQV
uniref:Uncharacterized protein n=1 Tax=Heterorhabditis bacteriophora TaxID=37862 RepID=A0A1I7XSF8_HETBA